ncbi:MAG: SPASM domain-containing protein [Thermodesulfovibrionia bacterium]|nr:SPASM domain-containing protein [Thermodesulfovibrionia bacterium]
MNWLNLFRPLRHKKSFYAWQIELTTRCPINCRMCIREMADNWLSGDMRIEDFKKLTPYFKDVETVILEGWGDSLLHPNFIEIIKLVKAEGAQAGFVTSGSILNKDYISELINAGIDLIGFSLSGVTPNTHGLIRIGSDLLSLTGHIQTFNQIKADKKLQKPRLHIIYLMLKDNISEIPRLPQLAKEIGIEDIVLTNLIHITNEWQEGQRVFRCNNATSHNMKSHSRESGNPEGIASKKDMWIPASAGMTDSKNYEELLKEAEAKAKELKITLRIHPLSPIDVAVCEENPLRNLYISVDGEVSPCVYLYPPLPSPFKRIYCGKEYTMNSLSFGNIFRESFDAIWNKKEYAEFRQAFEQRKRRYEEVYSYPIDARKLKRAETLTLPEPPEPCTTCHKMLGV